MYRVYTINTKNYNAKGYWVDNNKLYKDRIRFVYYKSYTQAKNKALQILKNSQEVCVSIESISNNKLYIVYRNKIQILSAKESFKTCNRRNALVLVKTLTDRNGGATVEYKKGAWVITSYR